MQCVILAGGLGLRLRPLTERLPKALVPINGRPFADYQLRALSRQNITDVVYCIGYKGEQIVDYVGNGGAWNLAVRYVDEHGELQGTGGALRMAFDAGVLNDCFFVLYGDSYLPIDFAAVLGQFSAGIAPALMTVLRNENRWDRSNVIFTPPWIKLYDKRADEATRARMRHIDYGLSVLSRKLVSRMIAPGEPADLADLFRTLSVAGDLAGFEVSERFYEVGSRAGLEDFARYARKLGL